MGGTLRERAKKRGCIALVRQEQRQARFIGMVRHRIRQRIGHQALIALATCDSPHLLEAIFGGVLVPEAVFYEVTSIDKPQSESSRTYLKGKVRTVDMRRFIYLDAYADAGETQAMLLYKEVAADYLLIDDKRGRKVAKINQIQTIGSLGVLLQAKRLGLIPIIAPLLVQISASAIYMNADLIKTVLDFADEPSE